MLQSFGRERVNDFRGIEREKAPDAIFIPQPCGFILSHSVVTLLGLAALFLSACVHVDVVVDPQISASNQDRNDQDPENPGETFDSVQPLAVGHAINMKNHRQETGSWCWAGSTRTMIEFIKNEGHTDRDQCNLVNEVFKDDVEAERIRTGINEIHCCLARRNESPSQIGAPEASNVCDHGLWPDAVLTQNDLTFLKVSYDSPSPFDDIQGWNDLTGQINQNLPYLVVVRWAGGGRHAVSIGGYSTSPDVGEFVHVYDPGQQEFYMMPFADFYNGIPGKFAHEFDYFNIKRATPTTGPQ